MPAASAYMEEENIYNLIPRPQEVVAKAPMYRSKFDGISTSKRWENEFGGTAPRQSATMGRPNGCNADHPAVFLRKHTKEPVLPRPTLTKRKEHIKPAVPKRDEQPVLGLMGEKDYITTNALEVILATPKKVSTEPALATQRPGFAKVPTYLARNKEVIAAEKQALETYMRMREHQDDTAAVTAMTEEERQQLLRHLKSKWAVVNAAYQKLGFVMDLASQVKRKEALESQLAEIEKDIKTLQRGDTVVVVQD